MTEPALQNDAELARYRTEVRAIGRSQRLAGFALVLAGAVAVWSSGYVGAAGPTVQWGGYAALVAGWVLMLVAIFLRTRYVRRRMRELG
ncbi:MAG TPA: hypothetical protein VGB60_04465 [Brevundimonas sp.]|jgi:membrane protein YdbS with pleckstrin-like domain|uniref:hypothetical protein n=1 Tax=Brevundimonas sp. TaxID=1871086 RepID=UPI002ED883C8